MHQKYRTIFYLLFACSGFSGLIYESIWTHYLKLFLGHAAFAQTLVLAIFMGGMAIGSWICSRYSGRWGDLMKGYAIAEGIIGLGALFFHNVFAKTIAHAYSTVIPGLGSPGAVTAYKWTISALLILPQSVLLGMTFPLMSAGLLRLFPERPGKSVGMLYFTNSIGAAIGVLASGFVMIRFMGLPGTIRTAGVINLALAVIVCAIAWKPQRERLPSTGQTPAPSETASLPSPTFFLAASLVTGAASFIYEIGWIRMLSLVLGSSTHAFELMLSAFILGLALGGLWIQRRIDRIALPARFLAKAQVVMGVLALGTLLAYGRTFGVMQWLVENLPKNDHGYLLFNLSSSAIAVFIMLPATFFAGMTLPLITLVLMRQGHGERSIGAVYAANTLGAIIGVFAAIHLGLPLLGLKGLITGGASLDIALGLLLFWRTAPHCGGHRVPAAVTAGCVAALALVLAFVDLDLYKMGSGVYRDGIILSPQGFRHLYHHDGKTATVDIFLDGMGSMRINTNGKTDATIMTDLQRPPGMDESTMTLAAAIPMALHPQASSVATIGLGSGMTTQTLLDNPSIRTVDTVEIEKGMVEAARNFRPLVEKVYTDPRSRIHIDDAKTFFSTRQQKYDIIISEPSNPWVSGVSGLFSEEFYRLVKNHIADDGLFVQWVQLYEIDTELVCSVLKAVSANFSDYHIYAPDDRDLLIVATKSGRVPALDAATLKVPGLQTALRRISIETLQDLELRKVGEKRLLAKLLDAMPVRANSDYYPVLDQKAAKARFMGASAGELLYFAQVPFPAAQLVSDEMPTLTRTAVTPTATFPKSQAAFAAMALRDYFLSGAFGPGSDGLPEADRAQAVRLRKLFYAPKAVPNEHQRLTSIFTTAENILPYLSPAELEAIWQRLESGPSAGSLTALDRQCLALCKAIGRRDGAEMASVARELLGQEKDLSVGMVKYVAASGVLGNLMQGRKLEAYELWAQYRTAIFGNRQPDLLFRLLAAESSNS